MEFTFLLKKIITVFIMPFPIGMLLLLVGIILLYTHKYTKAKIFLSLSFLWMFLISYNPLANQILYKYEMLYPALNIAPKQIKYIYVLGNGHHTNNTHPITSQLNEISSVRLNEAIRLYNQLDEKPTLILSGYSGIHDPTPNAVMQKKLALSLGVQEQNIHTEPSCKDTQEEAKAAKKYLGDAPFILVTSASHMQRALKFFHNEGLHPIAAPTNHLATIKYPNYSDIFSVHALRKMTIVWHEILGQLWQKVKGI